MALIYQKVETKLNFRKDQPTVYKIAQQTIPAVTFKQLVDEVAQSCGVNVTMSKAVIEGLINRSCHYMELGHAVQMGEFGTFKPIFTSKTQQDITKLSLKDVTGKKIRFYPGKRFKTMLADLSISQMDSFGNLLNEDSGNTPGGENPSGGSDGDQGENPLG